MKAFSLRNQILFLAVLPSILVATALGIYMTNSRINEIEQHIEQRAAVAARQLAIVAAQDIAKNNRLILRQIAGTALEEPGVRAVRILDTLQHEIATAGPKMRFTQNTIPTSLSKHATRELITDESFRFAVPVFSNDVSALQNSIDTREHLGWIEIEYSGYGKAITYYQNYIYTALTINLAAIFCILLGNIAAAGINRRIIVIREWLRSEDTAGPTPEKFKDELGLLIADLADIHERHHQHIVDMQHNVEQTMSDLRETLETVEIQNIELDLARKEAVSASRVKSEFLANTSHEIRTPLNGIIGFSNMLLKSSTDVRQRSSLETIRSSAENLLTIINDILDFSKLDSGKLVLDEVPVNIRDIADEALALAAPEAHQKDLELVQFSDASVPQALLADPLRIRQVLTNLIGNAIKFTHQGQVRLNLKSQAINDDTVQLKIEVRDTGIGLAPHKLGVVFEPFVQADATTTRQFGGTGLGLVIAKRLVETMGGEIGVHSTEGQGSTFWFTARLQLADRFAANHPYDEFAGQKIKVYEPQDMSFHALRNMLDQRLIEVERINDLSLLLLDIDSNTFCKIACIHRSDTEKLGQLCKKIDTSTLIVASQHQTEYSIPIETAELRKPIAHSKLFEQLRKFSGTSDSLNEPAANRLSGKKALAVDDNPANLRLLSLMLTELGAETTLANGGTEAIQLCEEQIFDIIFIDIQMPGIDGIESTRRIRQSLLNGKTPVIALSANISPDNPQALHGAGINLYLSKPITEAKLTDASNRFFNPQGAATFARSKRYLSQETGSPPFNSVNTPSKPTDSSAVIETLRPVDIRNSLIATKGNADIASEMLEILLASLPSNIDALRCYLNQGVNNHLTEIDELNHKLKGACCYSKLPALEHAVHDLEQALKNKEDATVVQKMVTELINCCQALLNWAEEINLETVFTA